MAVDMKPLYEQRKEQEKLYNDNYEHSNELKASILELREKNRYIDTAEIDFKNFNVSFNLNQDRLDDKDDEKVNKIKNKIINNFVDILDSYIKDNNSDLSKEYKMSFKEELCDVISLGDAITFIL